MARPPQIALDRDRVRAAIRALPAEYVRYMLPDAVELLAPARLHAVARQYLDLRRLRPDSKKARANLLADVKAFEHASLAGDFYGSFEVNSRNFMDLSRGTTHWIAEFRCLLGVCVKQARKGNAGETCQAFGILFGASGAPRRGPRRRRFLRRRGGAWLVGVDWKTVLPPWFNVLSATAQADEYTRRITGLLERHCGDETDRMLVVAQKITTPAQRQTLDRVRRTRGTRR